MDDFETTTGSPAANLEASQMHTAGQLKNDLALSESDEDDEDGLSAAKRPRLDDDFETL